MNRLEYDSAWGGQTMRLRSVLLVDDDADIRQIGAIALGAVGGLEVLEAQGGLEALQMAREHHPDVILLDVMMPDLDGPMTLAELRRDPVTQGVPVIFLTAKVQASDVQRYISMGAKGAIAKPFDPMTLAGQVRGMLGQTLS